ncbi:MAG: DUF4956 domain-containing protein [Bacteroidales bacterium]
MLKNFVTNRNNRVMVFLFLVMLSTPGKGLALEAIDSEFPATESAEFKESKAEKKKDKDSITINTRFYISLAMDVTAVMLIILLIYHPNYKKLDTTFTFIVFNVVIFLLTFVLNKVKISMGAAFGLFAVFSMLRYRTEGIGMKDMTYLFIFIALGLISGIQLEYDVLAIIIGIVLFITVFLDSNFILKREFSQCVQFEKIEMIKPELRDDLIEELRQRTGLNIRRVVIRNLDFLKDSAEIRIYYRE